MARVRAARGMSRADTVWSGYRFGDDKPPKSSSGLRSLAFVVSGACLFSLAAFVVSLTNSLQAHTCAASAAHSGGKSSTCMTPRRLPHTPQHGESKKEPRTAAGLQLCADLRRGGVVDARCQTTACPAPGLYAFVRRLVYSATGTRAGQAASCTAAACNKRSSANGRPTSCAAIGNPLPSCPTGTASAGNPKKLNGAVQRTSLASSSHIRAPPPTSVSSRRGNSIGSSGVNNKIGRAHV